MNIIHRDIRVFIMAKELKTGNGLKAHMQWHFFHKCKNTKQKHEMLNQGGR